MNFYVTGTGAEGEVLENTIALFTQTVSFEPKHENKSCSACLEDQQEPFFKFWIFERL